MPATGTPPQKLQLRDDFIRELRDLSATWRQLGSGPLGYWEEPSGDRLQLCLTSVDDAATMKPVSAASGLHDGRADVLCTEDTADEVLAAELDEDPSFSVEGQVIELTPDGEEIYFELVSP